MGRHDLGGPDEAGGTVDLTAVAADDALLDALGRHRRRTRPGPGSTPADRGMLDGPRSTSVPTTPAEPELTDLFETWRATIDAEPVPEPPSVDSVVVALRRTAGRRSLRPMLGVAVAICALLVSSAAIGARTARPGDVLWPVTQVLWSDRAESVVAGDSTRVALGQARMALDAGLTSEARSALVAASTVLPRVAERDGHQVLKADLDNLWSTLDWVQQQHAVAVGEARAATPPTSEASVEASTGTVATSSAGASASSSPPATSSARGTTSSPPPVSPTGTSPATGTLPPATSAPLPPAPPSVVPPTTTTTAATPTEPTVPSTPTSPAGTTPSSPTSPAPSTDAPTQSSTPSPSDPSSTASSATQEVLPVVPTDSTSVPTGGQVGEQSVDPAQKVQQAVDQQTVGGNG